MTNQVSSVFLSYNAITYDFVIALAHRLRGDARLSFWFAPWHSIPGMPIQEQMEDALWEARSCAVFISNSGQITDWQNEQMRTAIQTRVDDEPDYRIIPILVPGTTRPNRRDLPSFLRRYELVEFQSVDDEHAFKRLLAGILGIPPIQVEEYIQTQLDKVKMPLPSSGKFERGHALLIGVANYLYVRPLPETVLNDARDIKVLLTDPEVCGYLPTNVIQLLDNTATADGIRHAIANLAARTNLDDTVVIYFSGHGAHSFHGGYPKQYLLPYDGKMSDLPSTAISGEEMTQLLNAIKAERLLVLFDSCHSGGAGDPKGVTLFKTGLSEDYYQALAQGKGRVVMASSRTDELSWALPGMRNSVFTHYLLEALRGKGKTLGDGYVRVFDLFRHVAEYVPTKVDQHPLFKSAMEQDFPIALLEF